ncbi:MAG: hypothetical protein AB8G23_03315 [Myxococcota bacterium]
MNSRAARNIDRRERELSGLGRACRSLMLLLGCLALGCATTSPFNQSFLELQTPHFVLTSSLSEEATFELARNLEYFHAGVVDAVGLAGEPRAKGRPAMPRTRVLVFDDRSVGRPFAVRGEASQIINRPDGMIWVFRAGRSFDERISTRIRHQYAHQLIRDLSPSERPLWYEEGVAQMAGTVEEALSGVRIGRMVDPHRALIQDWRRSTLALKLSKSSVADDSAPARRLFEAQSWAIAHTLRFGGDSPNAKGHALDLYRKALDEGGPRAREEARKALGISDVLLTERVYQHLDRKRLRVRLVKVEGWDPSQLKTMPISDAEARIRLAELALVLERPGLAEEYFERALAAEPGHAAAQAGLAEVAAKEGRGEDLDSFAAAALGPDAEGRASNPRVLRHLGEAYRIAAEQAADATERSSRVAQGEQAFGAILKLLPRDVGARVGRGRLALQAVEEAGLDEREAGALRALEWFDAAGALRPGSLWIRLWQGHADLAQGLSRSAVQRAKGVISRTHAPEIERAATRLLEAAGNPTR